jgi:hypothetical protein
MSAATVKRFVLSEAIARADVILSRPPSRDWIDRPAPVGVRVVRFALPLSLLEPQNRRSHAPDWAMKAKRQRIWQVMVSQAGELRREPLPGRPQVLCTRFSSVCPDKYNDGFKAAIDALCMPTARRRFGLGYLRDDSPRHADVHQWWEYVPPKQGFGLIEVRARTRPSSK